MEILLSSVIGGMIMLSLLGLMRTSMTGYKKITSGEREGENAHLIIHRLRADLELMHHGLPLSIGDGSAAMGWDFIKGLYLPWSSTVGYEALFPKPPLAFPSDRIGFFIHLPPSLARQYGGKDIAHVLYFTALTPDYSPSLSTTLNPENLTGPDASVMRGFSRKLYRYFTPPDRVYARLNLLKKLSTEGSDPLRAIPRGPAYFQQAMEEDDVSFNYPESPENRATLSVVGNGVVSFSMVLSGTLVGDGGQKRTFIRDFLEDQATHKLTSSALFLSQAPTLDALLSSPLSPGTSVFSPTRLMFSFQLIPPSAIPSLTVSDWDTATGSHAQYLARNNLLPTTTHFSYALEK